MSTFSPGIKINGAISASAITTTNMYTAPANGYAILNVLIGVTNAPGSSGVSVGGVPIGVMRYDNSKGVLNAIGAATPTANFIQDGFYSISGTSLVGVYVGPGQTVASFGDNGSMKVYISGVEFVNT